MPEIDDHLMFHAIRRAGVRFNSPEWEDMVQEASIRRWEVRERPSPIQYAAIRNCVVDCIRLRLGRRNNKLSVACPMPILDETRQLPAEGGVDAMLTRLTLEAAFKVLSKREAEVIWAWASGYSQVEISRRLGRSASLVALIIKAGVAKMSEAVAA